jgi:actin-related protein 8
MKLPKKNFEMFNCILVIPDMYVRHHVRYIVNMLLGKLKFKSIFIHTESIMATFAMALPSACVVDVGSSKISVCCIDEGLILSKSIVRRHFGGDDINEMLLRLMCKNKALHYFPRNMINLDYHYHKLIVE